MTRSLNPNDPNVVMLELVARRLGADLCSKFAFVGGAVVGLLITDPANPPFDRLKMWTSWPKCWPCLAITASRRRFASAALHKT